LKFKIKRKKKQETEVMLCPKCMKATLKPAFNVSGWLASPMYKCKNCDYSGSLYFVPEDIESIEDLENTSEKEEDEDQFLSET
jgi:hypothetical protein